MFMRASGKEAFWLSGIGTINNYFTLNHFTLQYLSSCEQASLHTTLPCYNKQALSSVNGIVEKN